MDEERMHMFRNRFIKENARVSFSDKNKAICRKCKKKGHLSFNCPPKYDNKPFKSKNSNKKNSVHFKESAVCVSEFAGSTIHTQIDRLQHNLDQSKLYTCCKGNTHNHNVCPIFKKKHKKNPFSTPKRNLARNQPLKSYNPNIHSYYYHRYFMRQICHKKPSHTQYNFEKLMKKFRIHRRYFNTYKQSIIGYFMRNIRRMHKKMTS